MSSGRESLNQQFDESFAPMGNTMAYDQHDQEDPYDDDPPYGHTQFLDLTNGEGGARHGSGDAADDYYQDDESDDEDDGNLDDSPSSSRRGGSRMEPATPGKVVETGQEHTGRWTREEHEAFLSALKMYGKEWKKVAAKVKTRTVVQTRTHAQKYFQKLQKATTGSDKDLTAVEMGVAADAKKTSAQKRKKQMLAKVQRTQSTASTHAANHLMGLSNAALPTIISTPQQPLTSTTTSDVIAQTASYPTPHGFSTPSTLKEQALRPPQSMSSYQPPTGFFSGAADGWNAANTMKIVAPEPEISMRFGKFPEPSPAACGKRKLAEIAAAQMLAGVASSATKPMSSIEGDVTPPLPDGMRTPPESLPFPSSTTASTHIGRKGLSLQIVNPETLGVMYEDPTRRRRGLGGATSPTTPWDGQLEALVSESKRKDEANLSPDETDDDNRSIRDLPISCREPVGPRPHVVCGPGNAYGRSVVHRLVCEMNITELRTELGNMEASVVRHDRDEAGYNPIHTACSLRLMDEGYSAIACDMTRALLVAGADVACTDLNGNTPLHWAARAGDDRVAQMLLLKNCPPDAQNVFGDTALHWAMRSGKMGMWVVRMLIENGARASILNKNFKRALDVAAEGYGEDVANGESSNDAKKVVDKPPRKPTKSEHKKKQTDLIDEKREARANLIAISTQCRTLVLHHPECLEHVPKAESDWEVPDRVTSIMRRILPSADSTETTGIFPHEVTVSSDFDRAKLDLLSRVHSADYLAFVNELSKDLEKKRKDAINEEQPNSGMMHAGVPFTPMVQRTMMKESDLKVKKGHHSDTSFSAGSLRAARRAAGAVQHAVDCVLVGRHRNAFCVVRPPGHHAGIKGLLAGGESCGFCIFNNVAAGALHAISDERQLCQRCAIVDIDVHHGNGTEEIVRNCQDPEKLLFFSIHLYDHDKKRGRTSPSNGYKFYPGTGDEDDLPHNIINVPIVPLWKEQSSSSQGSLPQNTHNTRQKVKQKAAAAGSTTNSPRESVIGDDPALETGATVSSTSDYQRTSDTESETASSKTKRSVTPASSPRYMATGRVAYRRAIQDRLLPALRAFNPDLILISAGFDAAKGDVGNARHYAGGKERMGLDLEPEDYAWTTRKILEIADICCQGRVVSVLEGGYGRTPIAETTKSLDKSFFSECAVRHLHALIDPFDAEARFLS